MADPLVKVIIESRLATVLDPDEPLIATLNQRPSILPPVHVSLEHDYSAVDRITIGRPALFREDGVMLIVVNTPSGKGDSVSETLVSKIRDAFHNYYIEHFRVLNVDSAVIPEPDNGNFFQVKISVQYQFDFFK